MRPLSKAQRGGQSSQIIRTPPLSRVTSELIVTGMRITCKNPNCPRNGKPFVAERAGAQYCSVNCRVAAHRKRQAPLPAIEWYDGKRRIPIPDDSLAARLLEIAGRGDGGKPKTGRRFYYLALSHGYITADMSDTPEGKKSRASAYKSVTNALGRLRMAGHLGWDMVLDLTRELDEWQTYDSPREARAALRRRYDEDRWLGQKYYPVMVVEKDTLEPVCKPIASRWQMPFASSRGYSSLKLQHDVAEMLARRQAKTGQIAVIYFVSDLDPSGLDLQRAWETALENFAVVALFERIGLTPGQVQDHDLDRLAIEVKPSDSRAKAFIAQYGTRCWEADVLPASVIRQAVNDDVELWLDRKLWARRNAEREGVAVTR